MMQKLTHTLLALFISLSAFAQIEAPNLICVTTLFDGNVSLAWQVPPPNPCGNFLGYRIYATTNPTAPYFLLATITNPNQTTYTHINANGNNQVWHYFMTTDLLCPTLSIQQSNILDNLEPLTPPIIAVSINGNGNIELLWEVSPSVETQAYVIYQETNSGFIAIDTTQGRTNTRYEHIGVNTAVRQNYTIAAMDACGNIGLLYENPHQTILATATVNRCDKTIDLAWDDYVDWDNPIAAYQLRASVNGTPAVLVSTVSGEANRFPIAGFNDGDSVCLTAQAVELGTGHASMTNQVCLTASFVEPMTNIYFTNVSINNDNDLEVFWNWDEKADIETYDLSIGNQIHKTYSPLMPLLPINYLLDTSITADSGSLALQLTTTDSCGVLVNSDVAKTIFLKGNSTYDYQNVLTWTPLDLPYAEVYSYQIFRIVEDIPELIGSVNDNVLTFSDAINGKNPNESEVSYYVVAQAYIDLPDGTSKPIVSQSNTIAIKQPSKIFMPNAFAPEGKNNTFRPVMVFAENSQFEMYIYDRWGSRIFETTLADLGWNGRGKDGKVLQQGVYTYIVRITQLDGTVLEQRGTVTLIR
jgi:gliding motility-associated-like protein